MKKVFYSLIFALLFVFNINAVDALVCKYEVPSFDISFELEISESGTYRNTLLKNLNFGSSKAKAMTNDEKDEWASNIGLDNWKSYFADIISINNDKIIMDNGASRNMTGVSAERSIPVILGAIDSSSNKCSEVHLNIKRLSEVLHNDILMHQYVFEISTNYLQSCTWGKCTNDIQNTIDVNISNTGSGANSRKKVCTLPKIYFVVDDAKAYEATGQLVEMKKEGTISLYSDHTFSIDIDGYLTSSYGNIMSGSGALFTLSVPNRFGVNYQFYIDSTLKDTLYDAIERNNCYSVPSLGAYYYNFEDTDMSQVRVHSIVEKNKTTEIMNSNSWCKSIGICKVADVSAGEYISGDVNNGADEGILAYYRKMIKPIKAVSPELMSYKILSNGVETTLADIENLAVDICSDKSLKKYPETCLQAAIRFTTDYCENGGNATDCARFEQFKASVAEHTNIDFNAPVECGILSNDLRDKLIWVLDILKIAGPIVAIALGMVDFVKAIMGDDADKEMKTASKRLMTRIIAAILLFIVPVILAFLLDTFIGNKDGYDSDNPFCGVVKWENK